jgi:hypothetical protein
MGGTGDHCIKQDKPDSEIQASIRCFLNLDLKKKKSSEHKLFEENLQEVGGGEDRREHDRIISISGKVITQPI